MMLLIRQRNPLDGRSLSSSRIRSSTSTTRLTARLEAHCCAARACTPRTSVVLAATRCSINSPSVAIIRINPYTAWAGTDSPCRNTDVRGAGELSGSLRHRHASDNRHRTTTDVSAKEHAIERSFMACIVPATMIQAKRTRRGSCLTNWTSTNSERRVQSTEG